MHVLRTIQAFSVLALCYAGVAFATLGLFVVVAAMAAVGYVAGRLRDVTPA